MRETDIDFKNIKCKCGGFAGKAVKSKYQDRYSLYCKECGRFIKFASTYDKVIIKARINYLKEHNELLS